MPTPYSPGAGSAMLERAHALREERVRDLDQDAGAVAGQRVAAAGAAVRRGCAGSCRPLLDDVVRRARR